MGGLSIIHILVVAIVALVLFGRGKVSSLMGEFGKGISAFKHGIAEANAEAAKVAQEIPDAETTKPTV